MPVSAVLRRLQMSLRRLQMSLREAAATEAAQWPLWIPVLFGAGLCAFFALPWTGQRWAAVLLFAALTGFGLLWRGGTGRLCAIAGLLLLCGYGLAQWRSASVAAPRLLAPEIVQLVGVIEASERRQGAAKIRLRIAPFDPDLPPHVQVSVAGQAGDRALIQGLAPGARVSLKAGLAPPSPPLFPGGYDAARTAWFERIGASGFAMGPVSILVPAPAPAGFAALLAATRARLSAHLIESMVGAPGAISAALVTGEQGAIDPAVVQAMRDSGLAHLLSISGLHIAIVVAGTLWIVGKLLLLWPMLALRIPVRTVAAVFAAVAGVGYTLLAGGDVPTVRACIAALIVLVGVVIGRDALSLRLVATAALLILLVRPEAVLSPSFQLSFAAVTGLIALYNSRLGGWLNRPRPYDGWALKALRMVLALLVTGIVAEAMLSTTALFHFNRTGLYGVFANLVAIPLTSFIIMPLQVVALAADAAGFGVPGYWLLGKAISLLIALAHWVAAWPGAVARLPTMPGGAYGLVMIGGIWLCLWRGAIRLAGVLPILLGAGWALATSPADIMVSGDGRTVAVRHADNQLLRIGRAADGLTTKVWREENALLETDDARGLSKQNCNKGFCDIVVASSQKSSRVIVILDGSKADVLVLRASCSAADIVISRQILPGWCRPAWLRIDAPVLGTSHGVAVWLAPPRIRTVAAQVGDHPWRP